MVLYMFTYDDHVLWSTVQGSLSSYSQSMTALLLNYSLSKVAYMSVHITENEVIEDIFGVTPSRERMYYEFGVHIHKKVKLAVSISR